MLEPKTLDTPDVTGLDRAQRKAVRIASYGLKRASEKAQHRLNLVAQRRAEKDAVAKGLLKRQYPGRRGGRRIRLVWSDTPTFDTWRTDFEAIPRVNDKRFTLGIGEAAYEFTGDEETPPLGRRFTEIQVTEEEQDWLTANGVLLCDAGTFNELTEEELI